MTLRIFRSIFSLLAGLIFISFIVESVEFTIVTIANGGVTTDPEVYQAIRNQTWVLVTKLIYNFVAAFAGGFLGAKLAGYAPLKHGIILSAAQSLAFLWALTQPEIYASTPVEMWAMLIALTCLGIVAGAMTCAKQCARISTPKLTMLEGKPM